MKEKIIELFSELTYHARLSITLWIESIKLRLAIHLADIRQKARNRRYFVVLVHAGFTKNGKPIEKLRSIDNEMFKHLKRVGMLPKRMTTVELHQKSFYATPLSRNNSLSREDRRKAMQKYMRYQRVMNQRIKKQPA